MVGGVWMAVMQVKPLPARSYNHAACSVSDLEFDEYVSRINKEGAVPVRSVDDLIKACMNNEPPKPMVLGIGGSPRKGGNSDILLHYLLKEIIENRIPANALHLRDFHYQGCIGCEQCRKDRICTGLHDGMSLIYPSILASQGLVLVSPAHNYNVTSWMKAFIDRLYCFYDFDDKRPRGWSSRLAGQGRKAVLVAICEQENERDRGFTLDAMRLPLEALGYEIIAELPVYGMFDRAKVKERHDILRKASRMGSDLSQALLR